MSVGYASRLTKGVDYGECGQPELAEADQTLESKVSWLVEAVRQADRVVVHTGAGISTSCGIPDFRGPTGVWTLEKQGKKVEADIKFEHAVPSLTHMALVALLAAGKVKFLVSQNVDGLHLRSGFPLDRIAELHGNIFLETCQSCGAVHRRTFDVQGVGFKPTGRLCISCGGDLIDYVLDWDDALPDTAFKIASNESKAADLSLCLGSSLRIHPANELPLETLKKKGKGKQKGQMCVVNLQETKFGSEATMNIHATTDYVMCKLMKALAITIPTFPIRTDFEVHCTHCNHHHCHNQSKKSTKTNCPNNESPNNNITQFEVWVVSPSCKLFSNACIPYVVKIEVACSWNNDTHILTDQPFCTKLSLAIEAECAEQPATAVTTTNTQNISTEEGTQNAESSSQSQCSHSPGPPLRSPAEPQMNTSTRERRSKRGSGKTGLKGVKFFDVKDNIQNVGTKRKRQGGNSQQNTPYCGIPFDFAPYADLQSASLTIRLHFSNSCKAKGPACVRVSLSQFTAGTPIASYEDYHISTINYNAKE